MLLSLYNHDGTWHLTFDGMSYCITSYYKQEDLALCLTALNDNVKKSHPSWCPNVFIIDYAQGEIDKYACILQHTQLVKIDY